MKKSLLFLAVLLALPLYAHGKVYYYRDADGAIHFTDVPKKEFKPIPPSAVRFIEPKPKPAKNYAKGKFARYINEYASKYGIDPQLIKSVIKVESAFHPSAVSPKGAQGLMQLMPATARRFNVREPFDPGQNIAGGTRYIKHLMNRYGGDMKLTLAAYNAGETTVSRYNGIPPYPETIKYVRLVMNEYKRLAKSNGTAKVNNVEKPAYVATPELVAPTQAVYIYRLPGGALYITDVPKPHLESYSN